MEAYQYASGKTANLHFTVSPEHKANFEHQLSQLVPQYEKQCAMAFNITLSTQKSSTDTIAADENNEPFRDAKGQLVFRPGGHGALIENLNELEADLIFIKNIDNVVTDSKREPTIIYKEALAGFGLEMQQQIQQSIVALKNSKPHTEVANFVQQALQIELGSDYEVLSQQEQRDYLYKILNRPLRICGMVKNVGEPGGGPFWVNKRGVSSLQIVESAEIDMQQADQKQIMENATHFNPVDLICFTKDFEGKSFNLKDFVDNEAAFISEKSKDGKTLKAMELPGLWNGAMAFWTTLFVEVPLETFNPVKTVNDLFRPMHQ
jgi:hypothetical protein